MTRPIEIFVSEILRYRKYLDVDGYISIVNYISQAS